MTQYNGLNNSKRYEELHLQHIRNILGHNLTMYLYFYILLQRKHFYKYKFGLCYNNSFRLFHKWEYPPTINKVHFYKSHNISPLNKIIVLSFNKKHPVECQNACYNRHYLLFILIYSIGTPFVFLSVRYS